MGTKTVIAFDPDFFTSDDYAWFEDLITDWIHEKGLDIPHPEEWDDESVASLRVQISFEVPE